MIGYNKGMSIFSRIRHNIFRAVFKGEIRALEDAEILLDERIDERKRQIVLDSSGRNLVGKRGEFNEMRRMREIGIAENKQRVFDGVNKEVTAYESKWVSPPVNNGILGLDMDGIDES